MGLKEFKEKRALEEEEYRKKKEAREEILSARADKYVMKDMEALPEMIRSIAEADRPKHSKDFQTCGSMEFAMTKNGEKVMLERNYQLLPCPIEIHETDYKKGLIYDTFVNKPEKCFASELAGKEINSDYVYYSENAFLLHVESPLGITNIILDRQCNPLSLTFSFDDESDEYEYGDRITDRAASDKYEEVLSTLDVEGTFRITNRKNIKELERDCSTIALDAMLDAYEVMVDEGDIETDPKIAERIVNNKRQIMKNELDYVAHEDNEEDYDL